jgi:DSF synthase
MESATEHVSLDQLKEMHAIDSAIQQGAFGDVKFKVVTAESANVFCLGGDLALFLKCVEERDRDGLAEYALLATKSVWVNSSGFGARQLNSLAVVRGEAQGGGFEVALSCDVLVAERGAHFGFPETIFGLFPGMGAALLLATRVAPEVANRLIMHARRYSAEFLYEIGIIDILVEPNHGFATAAMIVEDPSTLKEFERRISRARELQYSSVVELVERWVDRALELPQRGQKAMRVLLRAQEKRRSRDS